jgi:hypothetical protein
MRATTGRSLLVLLTIVVLAAGCSSAPTPTATSRTPAPSLSATAAAGTELPSPTPTVTPATPVPPTALQLGNSRPLVVFAPTPSPTMADNGVGPSIGDIDHPFDPNLLYPIGYRWVRLGGSDSLNWQFVEKTPGNFTIDAKGDAVITDYAAHGLTIVLNLGIGECDNAVYGQHLANAEEVRRYGEYVRVMVRHFRDRVPYFELWNEPNGAITVTDYVAMVRHVVPIIRAEAPDAGIVIPASNERGWLIVVLDSGVAPLVDGIAWHPFYGTPADDPFYQSYPEGVLRDIKTRAEANGFHGIYIAEEMCWRTAEDTLDLGQPRYSEIVATKYIVRTIVTHRGLGIVAITGSGAIYLPITDTNALLAGATPTDLPVKVETTATHLRLYSFALPDGSHLVALWSDWLPVDKDPGVPATVTIDGLGGSTATAVDVMVAASQQLITSASGGALVIKDLLVKDYPIFLWISAK